MTGRGPRHIVNNGLTSGLCFDLAVARASGSSSALSIYDASSWQLDNLACKVSSDSPLIQAAMSYSAPASLKTRHYAHLASRLNQLQANLEVTERQMGDMARQLDSMAKLGAWTGSQCVLACTSGDPVS